MRLVIGIIFFLVLIGSAFIYWKFSSEDSVVAPVNFIEKKVEKPLEKYSFENLSKTQFEASEIELGEIISEESEFTSRFFYFWVDGSRVSGLVNIPNGAGSFGVILMFRGYVDLEIYETGVGTQRVGEELAKNGFVTLAPDFLGYGTSDNPSEDVMEERFQTYTTAITLLNSVNNLNDTFAKDSIEARVDSNKIGIWGHSNGGQISISILEITGANFPTVLWAPVTKPFPYSILYYTDEFDDKGKALRKVVARFEEDYEVFDYDLSRFFDRVKAPIELHQGAADDAVPQEWSDEFVSQMREMDKEIDYFIYNGTDHNLLPAGWAPAVNRAIDFYREKLEI